MENNWVQDSLLNGNAFGEQYAGVYFSRLVILRKFVNKAMIDKWGGHGLEIIPRIGAVTQQPCMVAGTVCKGAAVSSQSLQRYLAELNLDVDLKDWRDPPDTIVLEDESSRLKLVFENESVLPINKLVTGMVIGIKGHLNNCGDLLVEDFTFPSLLQPSPIPKGIAEQYIILLSGLEFGHPKTNLRKIMRIRDFIVNSKSNWRRIIIAGNTISLSASFESTIVLDDADTFLASLASLSDVDLIPGVLDPTLSGLPQPPIHGALLPRADMFESFHSVTNPYITEIEGVRFAGTSGQAVRDIQENCNCSALEALHITLRARCLAPTAPDSLLCHSNPKSNLLIDNGNPPHILFSGSHEEFETVELEGTVLISVPAFRTAASFVVVSLHSLNVECVQIQ
eukprot:Gregarina_sp_Poly_1__2395@NODE_1640_length_3646_cov_139_268231_g1081_i0_p2_GENE_NODE_1640_length_3646_cov_139_268231_g1081_i0NODE_1640_length_3646_cov_139_268231_g1081_i0_p2_ORF_typecomplete_len396_score38_32DNA_pol_E_B/PF04042_16/5_4e27DNA_pol_D_N/PF18018_1/2_2e20tRNA_anticodon/PF01336_25/0_32_NODE_1640_length_3646_cov_139_268231_g1081_i023013488